MRSSPRSASLIVASPYLFTGLCLHRVCDGDIGGDDIGVAGGVIVTSSGGVSSSGVSASTGIVD